LKQQSIGRRASNFEKEELRAHDGTFGYCSVTIHANDMRDIVCTVVFVSIESLFSGLLDRPLFYIVPSPP